MTLQQYNERTFKKSKLIIRFVTCLYLFSSFMLYEGYAGALKSLLAVVVYPKPPNTFKELAVIVAEQNWHITVCCDNMMFQMGNSSDPNKKAVAKRLELNLLASVDFTQNAYLNVSDIKTGHKRNGQIYATVDTKKSLADGINYLLLDE